MSNLSWDDLTTEEQAKTATNISESLARSRHKDYDSVVKAVLPKLRQDEGLRDEILRADDPGEALYSAAQKEINPPLDEIFGD